MSKRSGHCNKRPYKTLLAAQIALKQTVQRSKKGELIITAMSVYKCQYCPNFHIGRDRVKGIDWKMVAANEAKVKKRIAEYSSKSHTTHEQQRTSTSQGLPEGRDLHPDQACGGSPDGTGGETLRASHLPEGASV